VSINLTTGIIPFSELFERLMTLAKMDSFNNEDAAKGLVNDSYIRTLPAIEDWSPITEETNLSMTAYYSTGTVACAAGGTTVTLTGGTWTSGMTYTNGWRIKFAGLNNIYRFTYTGPTSATISPALEGATNLTAQGYTLFRDEYSLPSDFDRLLKNGSLYVYQGGRLHDTIAESPRDKFREEFSPEVQDPIRRCLLTRTDANGYRMIRVNPPPQTAKVYPVDYIKKVAPMKEYTVGTVSVNTGSTTVTGSGTQFATNVTAGMYFRVDTIGQGDSSKWYKVASVTNATTLVLESAYEDGIESGADYTICSAPTAFPSEFHEFILYDALATAVASATDPNSELIIAKRMDILSRLKKNYKSRRSNQQFGVDDDGYR
jgi:hypothetical protein